MVLLSGGIDSAVASLIASKNHTEVLYLTFDYQQVNKQELACAKKVARSLGKNKRSHVVYPLDFRPIAESQCTHLLKGGGNGRGKGRFNYYVPARNLIFLAHASALAESSGIEEIYVGSNFQDAPGMKLRGYPDSGRPFLASVEKTIRKALKFNNDITIRAPLLSMNKFEVIRYGHDRRFDFRSTWSCYLSGPEACGECPACHARIINFFWAGLKDPIRYKGTYAAVLEEALSRYV